MSYPVAFPLEAGSGPLVGDLDVVLEQLLALLSHERQGNAADQMIPRAVEIIENRALIVQSILSLVQADATSRLAALLHMLPELAGELTPVQFVKRFGPEVAQIKENLQKLAKMTFATRVLNQPHGKGRELPSIELLRRMLLVIAADVRVVIVHLAIRLDLLRQFSKAEVPSDEAVLVETRDVLVPLANRLGLSHLKWELEDLCFRLLEPQKYKLLAQALAQKRTDRESFVESAVEALKAALSKKSLQVQVYGRPKHLSSIAQKIEQKHLILAQIHDLHALRVIVQTIVGGRDKQFFAKAFEPLLK